MEHKTLLTLDMPILHTVVNYTQSDSKANLHESFTLTVFANQNYLFLYFILSLSVCQSKLSVPLFYFIAHSVCQSKLSVPLFYFIAHFVYK